VYEAKSGAVAINITFQVTDQWNGGEWESWAEYAVNEVQGAYYVVKRDGAVNESAVEQLAKAIRWNGDLRTVIGQPPDIEVQITVSEEVYDGTTSFKAGWLNPGDHVPSFGASPEDIMKLHVRFGSLLRAAASASVPAPAKKTSTKTESKAEPVPRVVGEDDLPF